MELVKVGCMLVQGSGNTVYGSMLLKMGVLSDPHLALDEKLGPLEGL